MSNCSLTEFQSIPTPAHAMWASAELSILVCKAFRYPAIDLSLISRDVAGIIFVP